MSVYISILEASREPQLLRARGMIIPFGRESSCNSPLSLKSDYDSDHELCLLATDDGWGILSDASDNIKIYPYGSAIEVPRYPALSISVSRYECDLNPLAELGELLEDPVAKIVLKFCGYTHSINLRRGDIVAVGGPQLPLPYRSSSVKFELGITSDCRILLRPILETQLNGTVIPNETIIQPSASECVCSGEGWLVGISFLDYISNTHE